MPKSVLRGWLVAVGCLLVSGLLLRSAWLPGVRPSGLGTALARTSPDRSLPLVLALTLCALTGWLALTMTFTVLARLPGATGRCAARALSRLAPFAMRRLAEVLVGATTVLASTAGVAQAAQVQRPAAAELSVRLPSGLDRPAAPMRTVIVPAGPAVSLDRPVADPARGLSLLTHQPAAARTPASRTAAAVTVRVGDSLWAIAARALPRDASPERIERSWHQWYQANRGVIGPDPGLLQPGQLLTPPSP